MNLNEKDLDVFFDPSIFGDEVTRANGAKFFAIFDETFFDPNLGEVVLESTSPRLTCKLADAAGIARKSLLTIKGRTFSVIKVEPDGTGTASIKLSHHTEEDEEE